MTEHEIDQLLKEATPEQLKRGMERLRYSLSGFEMGLAQGRAEAMARWQSQPTCVLELPVKQIPTVNRALATNRRGFGASGEEVKRILEVGYGLISRWMDDHQVDRYMDTSYQRNVRQRPKEIARATTPVVHGPVKVVVEVPGTSRDIDGYYLKPIWDSLTEANFWADDDCVDEMNIVRKPELKAATNPIVILIFERMFLDEEKGA